MKPPWRADHEPWGQGRGAGEQGSQGLRVGLPRGYLSGAVEGCIWAEGTARAKAPRQERVGVSEELRGWSQSTPTPRAEFSETRQPGPQDPRPQGTPKT